MFLSVLLLGTANWLVVPGRSLGHVRIGPHLASLNALGTAQYGDAAMQKSWSTWIGTGGGRIDVRIANDAAGTEHEQRRIHVVRATSSRFHLTNGIHPGSPARKLKSAYPAAKIKASYTSPSGKVAVWDDVKRGLGWEVAPNGRVLALIVHDAGDESADVVIPYVSTPLHKV